MVGNSELLSKCIDEAVARFDEAMRIANAKYEECLAIAETDYQNGLDEASSHNKDGVEDCVNNIDGSIDPQGLKSCLTDVKDRYDLELAMVKAQYESAKLDAKSNLTNDEAIALRESGDAQLQCHILYTDVSPAN